MIQIHQSLERKSEPIYSDYLLDIEPLVGKMSVKLLPFQEYSKFPNLIPIESVEHIKSLSITFNCNADELLENLDEQNIKEYSSIEWDFTKEITILKEIFMRIPKDKKIHLILNSKGTVTLKMLESLNELFDFLIKQEIEVKFLTMNISLVIVGLYSLSSKLADYTDLYYIDLQVMPDNNPRNSYPIQEFRRKISVNRLLMISHLGGIQPYENLSRYIESNVLIVNSDYKGDIILPGEESDGKYMTVPVLNTDIPDTIHKGQINTKHVIEKSGLYFFTGKIIHYYDTVKDLDSNFGRLLGSSNRLMHEIDITKDTKVNVIALTDETLFRNKTYYINKLSDTLSVITISVKYLFYLLK